MKGYHYLMKTGHLFTILAQYSECLIKTVKNHGLKGFIRFIRETVSGPWPDEETVFRRLNRNFQLRLEWCKHIVSDYNEKMIAEWGRAENSEMMIRDNEIIIPCVNLGNIVLVPQPVRGWGDDPQKLYHSTQLWPHHQYTAFYLWLKHGFKADAMISLGTHGSHEWLPGKQAGLSQSCAPEVLIQELPNLYPYIMDNIGEGLQAKRRGRGVLIDYLIPAMKKAGIYEEYRDMGVLIAEYNDALTRSAELAEQKLRRIKDMVKKLGLDKDLLLEEIDEEAVEELEHYLVELQEAYAPYGMHTFGISPQGEELKEFCQLVKERNEEVALSEIEKNLTSCYLETDRLIGGLEGKYVPSAQGNDPLRNIDAIPTGNNFYGFDPAKVPSKDAYKLGKKQAQEMVEKYLKEKGTYPEKIGLIFWSIELQRNEGTQVGTALHLLGMKPVWDKNNKVSGVEPIPGAMLNRPGIDVHIPLPSTGSGSGNGVALAYQRELLSEGSRAAGKRTNKK
ncbi:Chelatase domain-containing protein [Desulfonema magnum]|uniref:Chelatase domain-containing protein n=2 Tax=Desulfonema magnum TaxID=45655 RepID=A0A975BR94_9BACT|nr:Chelatase domain-containing protein [Desulfonema magnum]